MPLFCLKAIFSGCRFEPARKIANIDRKIALKARGFEVACDEECNEFDLGPEVGAAWAVKWDGIMDAAKRQRDVEDQAAEKEKVAERWSNYIDYADIGR